MKDDAVVNVTNAATDIYVGDLDGEADNVSLHEMDSYDEEMRESGSAGEVLTRVELDLAYSSEKLLNLDILLMHVASREGDYESLSTEIDNISDDSVGKALEFDFLSRILDSEVRQLENFTGSLQREIVVARKKISSYEHQREDSGEVEGKLNDSEESLKQSQNQLAEMRMQCAKFQGTLLAFSRQENGSNKDTDVSENGQFSFADAKLKMQTAEQQRHILRMLEKSLARELSLERRLTDSNLRLDSAEHDIFSMDETVEDVWQRLFEAENAAEVLLGVSKELKGRLQIVQFNLTGSVLREGEMRAKLQDLMEPTPSGLQPDNLVVHIETLKANLKEAEDKYNLASSEASTLREKVHLLEEHLNEYEIQLQNTRVYSEENQDRQNNLGSEVQEMKHMIEDLKETTSKAESRAESAEAECTSLTRANSALSEELGLFKTSDIKLLEKRLRESNIQLQQAKASAEASQEQQNMLYSAIKDMENLINDLKSKVSRAESRAEKAEAKCAILTETNLEVNEELSFVRTRMEFLETSLHQADTVKITTAKEISTRTKVITDLLLQLAMERERLQKQITSLTKENNILALKFRKTEADASVPMDCNNNEKDRETSCKVNSPTITGIREPQPSANESSTTTFQVSKSGKDATEVEEPPIGETSVETVRMIEATPLKSKYMLMAVVVLLISYLAVYVYQQEGCPF